MNNKPQLIRKALASAEDPARPLQIRVYKPNPSLTLYKMHMNVKDKYRFHPDLVRKAQAILSHNQRTETLKATDISIALFHQDLVDLCETLTTAKLYAPTFADMPLSTAPEPGEVIPIASAAAASAAEAEIIQQAQEEQPQQTEEPQESQQPEVVSQSNVSLDIEAYKNPYELNRAIESLIAAKGLEKVSHEDYNANEKAFIARYSGYGGLEKFGATGKALLFEFYTPEPLVETMWRLAYHFGYEDGSILEPSAATGRFLKHAPAAAPILAYEINPYSAAVMQALYPQAEVVVEAFETMFINEKKKSIGSRTEHLRKFDLVIGNPPYGKMSGRYTGMGEKDAVSASNYIDYFISRGLDVLNPGGLLVYVVGAESAIGGQTFFSQGWSPAKKLIAEKANILRVDQLPEDTFETTGVVPEIIVLQRK